METGQENPQASVVELRIISWNINRKKKIQESLTNTLGLHLHNTHIFFLQETAIGVEENIYLEGWWAFYTKYSNIEKGTAILVKNDKVLNFELCNQEVDRNGRYVVVRCKLRGQQYTLVSVYNHEDDIMTLDLLLPYLQNMSVGTLVIGGDFNTTFSQNDRAKCVPGLGLRCYDKKNSRHLKIRSCVQRFMRYLQLVDVFRRKNGDHVDETFFTYKTTQNKGKGNEHTVFSRLDYFFMPEERLCSVKNCEVITYETDHSPLLLQLNTMVPHYKYISAVEIVQLNTMVPHHQYISAVEIVAAIQSLQLSDVQRPDGKQVSDYKNLRAELVDNLKSKYNQMIQKQIQEKINPLPQGFNDAVTQNGYYYFNVEYLILAQVLAWHLTDWGKTARELICENWSSDCQVRWTDLRSSIQIKLKNHPGLAEFHILEHLLSDGEPGYKELRKGCPLTPILHKLLQNLCIQIDRSDNKTDEEEYVDVESI